MGFFASQYEWLIIEILVVGFLVYELISVRRAIRRAREADAKKAAEKPP